MARTISSGQVMTTPIAGVVGPPIDPRTARGVNPGENP